MPRPSSKRQRALDQLDIARDAITKAITLLGGRVRVRSVKRNQRVFTVRQYLESIDSRINVSRDLLQVDQIVSTPLHEVPEEFKSKMNAMLEAFPELKNAKRRSELRDDFEREYDATRRPQC